MLKLSFNIMTGPPTGKDRAVKLRIYYLNLFIQYFLFLSFVRSVFDGVPFCYVMWFHSTLIRCLRRDVFFYLP